MDAAAALLYVKDLKTRLGPRTRFVLWGQSIGAGVATSTAASMAKANTGEKLDAIILETPFLSVKEMLVALYPQRWLPYRYLWPFLWNMWDSKTALEGVARSQRPRILVLTAGKDEVVPPAQAKQIIDLCRSLELDVTVGEVPGALHTEATGRQEGTSMVLKFMRGIARNGRNMEEKPRTI